MTGPEDRRRALPADSPLAAPFDQSWDGVGLHGEFNSGAGGGATLPGGSWARREGAVRLVGRRAGREAAARRGIREREVEKRKERKGKKD